MPPGGYSTHNFKLMLTAVVTSLDAFLDNRTVVSDVHYKQVHNFVRLLMSDSATYGDIFTKFLNLSHLKTNDWLNIYTEKQPSSILTKLIQDTRATHQNTKLYQALLAKRADIITEVMAKGKPAVTWDQPKAVLPGHPQVEQFLRSHQQTFVYQNFTGIVFYWQRECWNVGCVLVLHLLIVLLNFFSFLGQK